MSLRVHEELEDWGQDHDGSGAGFSLGQSKLTVHVVVVWEIESGETWVSVLLCWCFLWTCITVEWAGVHCSELLLHFGLLLYYILR
jgi:hypothetical protein